MYIILFLIILAVLVLVHEFGHFFAAKRFGVRVDEFGLGFPPRIWGRKKGETVYSVNAIPFGGFVKIFGETPDEESISGADSARSFVRKPRWIQAVILIAGIAMNVIFAWALFSIAYMSGMTAGVTTQNMQYASDSHVVVLDVLPEGAAAKAGMKSGDAIVAYRPEGGATTTVSTVSAVQDIARGSGGAPIDFEVLRGGKPAYLTVTPAKGLFGSDSYAIGISMDLVGKVRLPFLTAISQSAELTGRLFVGIFTSIFGLIHDAILGHADLSQISGPVGIARLVGDAEKLGVAYVLSFTAFISLNLAALNLIPFPALDGGRILFVAIEAVRRKSIKPEIANTVNAIGFGLLILFMLFVTYRDIMKIWG